MNDQDVRRETREHDESVIRRVYDAGAIDAIACDDEGWDSRVYLVNHGRAVFKFPRSPQVKAQYRHEIAALRLLEHVATPVRTPRVRWQAPDLAYFGYEGIVGTPLFRVIAGLGIEQKRAIGSALGRFLKELHGTALADAPKMTLEDEIEDYFEKYRLAMPALTQTFTPGEMEVVEAFFCHELPTTMRRLGVDLRLSHGDLGPWNIIVATDGTPGVIDFGDVAYCDTSKDFSGFGDDAILNAALDAYGDDDLLGEKAGLRIRAFPVLDMPFYLGKRNQAGVDACLELARRTIIERRGTGTARFKRD